MMLTHVVKMWRNIADESASQKAGSHMRARLCGGSAGGHARLVSYEDVAAERAGDEAYEPGPGAQLDAGAANEGRGAAPGEVVAEGLREAVSLGSVAKLQEDIRLDEYVGMWSLDHPEQDGARQYETIQNITQHNSPAQRASASRRSPGRHPP